MHINALNTGSLEQVLTMLRENCLMFARLILSVLGLTMAACAPVPRLMPHALGVPAPVYSLEPGDKIFVKVAGQEPLSGAHTLDSGRSITLPLIGAVAVEAGSTPTALAERIEQRLRQGYLRAPKVSVEIAEMRPVYLFGAIARPGPVAYRLNMDAAMAIGLAGGLSARAERRYLEITRQVDGRKVQVAVPFTTPLQPGDHLWLRERRGFLWF